MVIRFSRRFKNPDVTVLSKKRAEKYFGDWKTAVGQFLKLDNNVIVKVAGILENVPGNSDFPLELVTSFETFKKNPDLYGSARNGEEPQVIFSYLCCCLTISLLTLSILNWLN